MIFPDHPFWTFSVEVHRQPGVHEACLALQTRYAVDVNLLFFCCWVGAAGGGPLTADRIHLAMDAVAGWQEEIVRPIWKSRWRLKPGFTDFPVEKTEALRRCLIQAELDAEHIEQLHLAETVGFERTPNLGEEMKAAHAGANIAAYLHALSQARPDIVRDAGALIEPLTVLLAACFPGMERRRVRSVIEELNPVMDRNRARREYE